MASKAKKPTHVAECHGVKVPDNPMMTPDRIKRINAGLYEGDEIKGALSVIEPGDKVLEMGSGIGVVGAIAAKAGKAKKVISFEANPSLLPHITALYKLNRLSSKIEVRNEVLVSAPNPPKSLPFYVRKSYLGSSLIKAKDRPTEQVDVPVASYEALRADYQPDVLLMDIEGGELDFLRHASLKGIRAIVIEFHPKVYGKQGIRECKALLGDAGFVKIPACSSRHIWTCVHAPGVKAPIPTSTWTREITPLDKAIVVPPFEQKFVQAAGVLDSDGVYCSSSALWRNGRALTIRPPMPKGDLPTRKGTWLWGGVLWMHFGHFLAESTSRLWALHNPQEKIDGILFVPKRPRNGTAIADFQTEFIKLMAPDTQVAVAATPEVVDRLIIPGQGFGLGAMNTGTPEYRAAMQAMFANDIKAEGDTKLYISRSKLPSGRGNLLGEAELEKNLRARGYTIYHPEKHDLAHQIATYRAARKIVAAEGSALHLVAMVADPETDVAIVVRRPSGATRNLERHLEAFMGKPPLTITQLTRSWKPLGKARPRTWLGEIDMPAVQDALTAHGFIGKGKSWDQLDQASVQERLGDKFELVA